MKIPILLSALLVCALPLSAQSTSDSVFRVVTPVQAQKFDNDISLHLRDVTLEQALTELQKQSAVPLNWSFLNRKTLDTPMSIDIETPSFNRAFDAIADEAGIAVMLGDLYSGGPRFVSLKIADSRMDFPRLSPDAPASIDGLFAARLKKLEVKRLSSLDWVGSQAPARQQDEHLNVSFDVTSDPRLAAINAPRLRVTRADDEQGRSLVLPPIAEKKPFYFFSMQGLNGEKADTVALLPPQNDARRLAHLDGVAIYILPGAREIWETPIALDGKFPIEHDFKNSGQDVHLSIQSIERKGENLAVNLVMSAQNSANWGALGNPLFSSSNALGWMHFEDASGAILRAKSEGGGQEGNRMNARATFYLPQNMTPFPRPGVEPTKLALPLKFTLDVPTEFVQTEVPFSFSDIPLP